METQQLAVSRIIVAKGNPPLDEATVAALVESMGKVGLINPVTVWRPSGFMPQLIAGHHRLEAARRLAWETIPAFVVDGDDRDQKAAVDAEIRSIDENLVRRTLSDAERAALIGRRKELYETQHPETKPGSPTVSRQIGDLRKRAEADRFTKQVARATGKSERAVQRDATRARAIPRLPELVGTSLDKGAELDALARLEPKAQEPIITRAIAGEKVSARTAPREDAPNPALTQMKRLWQSLGDDDRAAFLAWLRT
jgi:ParB-like chromosome segregation protein Spo0J